MEALRLLVDGKIEQAYVKAVDSASLDLPGGWGVSGVYLSTTTRWGETDGSVFTARLPHAFAMMMRPPFFILAALVLCRPDEPSRLTAVLVFPCPVTNPIHANYHKKWKGYTMIFRIPSSTTQYALFSDVPSAKQYMIDNGVKPMDSDTMDATMMMIGQKGNPAFVGAARMIDGVDNAASQSSWRSDTVFLVGVDDTAELQLGVSLGIQSGEPYRIVSALHKEVHGERKGKELSAFLRQQAQRLKALAYGYEILAASVDIESVADVNKPRKKDKKKG